MNLEGNYALEYQIEQDIPVIYVFRRDLKGKKHIDRIDSFRPYFYVPTHETSKNLSPIFQKVESGFKSVYGDSLTKLTYANPKNTYHLRDKFETTFEADVLFPLRYMLDNVDEVLPGKLRLLYIDIETASRGGFADYTNPTQPIIMVSVYDNFEDRYYTYAWRKDLKYNVFTDSGNKNTISKFNNEATMLQALISKIIQLDSDIIIGWNVYFDMNYIVSRCRSLRVDYSLLSPLSGEQSGVYIRERETAEGKKQRGECVIRGRTIFDLQYFYKRVVSRELVSYALDSVAREELGEGKTEFVLSSDDLWENDIERFISYNINDVYLTKRINEKCKVLEFYDNIYRFACLVNHNDCRYNSRIIETLLMRENKGLVFPTKPKFREKTEEDRIEGAYVAEPVVGLHKNVISFDARGLYPNLIRTFNLSAERVREKADPNTKYVNGVYVDVSAPGLMPSIIEKLMYIKDHTNKTDPRYMTAKTITNSSYGAQSMSSFRLYNKQLAETITFLGRETALYMAQCAKDLGLIVLLQDTDSVFIKLPEYLDGTIIGLQVKQYINNNWNKVLDKYNIKKHYLQVEFEKVCSSVLIVAKKRYACRVTWKDGTSVDTDGKPLNKIEIKGLDVRRSDGTRKARDIQSRVITMILKEEATQQQVLEYIRLECSNIKQMKYGYVDIALPTKLNQDEYESNLPRKRSAKWSNKHLHTNFKTGSKFYMLYVKQRDTDVIAFDDSSRLPKDIKLDWGKTLNNNIFMKVENIMRVLGWEQGLLKLKNEVVNNQSNLEKWL